MRDVAFAVVGALLGAFAVWLWRKGFPEIYQRYASDEPTIGGTWNTAFSENGTQYTEEVELNQIGRKVWGLITLKGGDEVSTYQYQGVFKNLILTATYASTDRSEIEQGAFALRYTRHGTLEGQYVLLAKQTEQLVSSEYKWTKKA